jgi:hypothetical protein
MLHDELLEQARFLAQLNPDPAPPTQANLRRAVSSAYYALFHLLVHEGSARAVGKPGTALVDTIHHGVRRWFNHGEMAKVSEWFVSGKDAPDGLKRILQQSPNAVVTKPLRDVAAAFIHLQERRHEADYDLAVTFKRPDAMSHVQRAEQAFVDWGHAQTDPLAPLYLLLLLTGKEVIARR